MIDHFSKSKKSLTVKQLLNETVAILQSVGIPVESHTERRLERIALCFLAVAGVTSSWQSAKSLPDKRRLKTRDIINFINQHFEESISSGSYDDIRRKDLRLLVLANLVINSGENPSAATNDPTRGYSLETEFAQLVKAFKTKNWKKQLAVFLQGRVALSDTLARQRNLGKLSVDLPDSVTIELSQGEHNLLQKRIVEEFLPRFGKGCQVLYIGDTTKKILHLERDTLSRLSFFELSHEKLPDIIAYDAERNWLYLIEAVHSSGAMNEARVLELKRATQQCTAQIIFVTAFLKKSDFRKWILDIA